MGASGRAARLHGCRSSLLFPFLSLSLFSLSVSLSLFSLSLSPSFLITRSSPFGICGGGRRIQACKSQSPSDGKSDHSSSFSGGLWSVLQDRCLDPGLVPGSSLNLVSGLRTCPLFLSPTPLPYFCPPHLSSVLVVNSCPLFLLSTPVLLLVNLIHHLSVRKEKQ